MKHLLYFITVSFVLGACADKKVKTLITATEAIRIDNNPAECPYLTKDSRGKTVLSWVRLLTDSMAFCYATTIDGKTFSKPIVIPNSNNIQPHGENLPKIIFKPSGEIIALWGAANANPKNKYSGQVFYTQSFDNGKTWSTARPLVNDPASYDQRYYDVALLPNGEAGIIWLDNRKISDKEGSGLYFATTNGNKGFEDGKLINEPCCQCCRTDLFIDSKGGIHALFRGIVKDSIRDMVHIVSVDGGKTFSQPKRINEDNWVINGCPHTGPAMTENKEGIHFAWFTGGKNKGCFYTKTIDNGYSFMMYDSVSASGAHPQLSALSNGDLFIVWDEVVTSNNKAGKRIGVQHRTKDGKRESKTYITSQGSYTSYPVISAIDNNSSIIAYTTKIGDKNFIAYQVAGIQ